MILPSKELVKILISRILAPNGIKLIGANSRILRPRKIDGPKHIEIGTGTFIRAYSWLSAIERYGSQNFKPRFSIGNHVYIGHYAFITCIDSVTIEDYCVLSDCVYISDSAHGYDPDKGPIMQQPLTSKGLVRIGKGSFLGYRAVIMPGVTLGKHCVVGCNTVVTSSFPDYCMIVGSPARCIKIYSTESKCWITQKF
jgi:lipopolysaccharide O-acetyltransferase